MIPPKRALVKLDRYFTINDPSRDFVVLLVDELDYMVREVAAGCVYQGMCHRRSLDDEWHV